MKVESQYWLVRNAFWFFPILIVVLVTPWTPFLDMTISNHFYLGPHAGKAFESNRLFDFFYNFGTWFAFAATGIAGIFFVLSYFKKKWMAYRKPALLMILTLFIGAGFLVNLVFKEHWGRPRPRQIVEFGGNLPFRPYYEPHLQLKMTEEKMRSFPSGHSSMGFYFLCLCLVGYRIHKNSFIIVGLLVSLILGGLLGLTRIAQGGHFFSDVLMSAVIMWFAALFSDWIVYTKLAKRL